MNSTVIDFEKDIQEQLTNFKNQSRYVEIANLLTYSLKHASSDTNRSVFGYLPNLFREVAIANSSAGIPSSKLSIGEPVIYKICFPNNKTIKEIPYFYLFCYLKNNSSSLNVYFQSASRKSKNFSQRHYAIAQRKIKFEGIVSAFKDSESAICVSDPGHFVPGLNSSFYIGSKQINFPEVISHVIESICVSANIKLNNIFLFGSSAGGMGALLTSTYFSSKVQVMAVNAQIITYDHPKIMKSLLETSERNILLKKFANRISCLNRFQQNINSIPNIYLLANVNDSLHHRNYKFYQLYQKLFVAEGRANQSIFDSYYGVEGHGRPDKATLKKKIKIACESLKMKANSSSQQLPNQSLKKNLKIDVKLLQQGSKTKQKYNSGIKSALGSSIKNYKLSNGNAEYQRKLWQADNLFQKDFQQSKLSNNQKRYPIKGKISNDKVAIAGEQNWLYINSGSNSLMKYHTGSKQLAISEIKQWSQLLQRRIAWHHEHQIEYQHLFVPNKIAIYPEYYPYAIDVISERPIIQLEKECGKSFLYPCDLFLEQKNNYRLYNKHDCHWNFWGCYLAYSLVCQSLGIEPKTELLDSPIKIVHQRGDLGSKYGVTEIVLRLNVELNSRIIKDNQLINHSHQGSVRVLKNDSISQGKMIIFGDSFCNPGFPDYSTEKRMIARLSNLFAETLNEVHFVWTPWIDYDYIEREKPNFVLTEMAERFVVRVPDDRNHPPLEEFAAQKLSKFKT